MSLSFTQGPGARIVGLGHYQPARVVTNDDLAREWGVDTNDEWIQERVGIKARRFATAVETSLDMAVAAAGKALANAGVEAAAIDLVVVATLTPPTVLPNVATQVAARLDIVTPAAYDLNTACSGFSYALATAQHAIAAGSARTALVIGAEKLSSIVDFADRTTCILFADGAGAAVVTASETNGIGPVVWGSDGPRGELLQVDAGGHIRQDGQPVFRWATTAIAPIARQACERAGIDPKELAAFIPHQANVRIIDHIAKRLGVAEDAIVGRDIIESGNTSSASIPITFSKLVERGELPSGAPVLLFGFGGGLTYAGQVVITP